jgi:hypothetical protein
MHHSHAVILPLTRRGRRKNPRLDAEPDAIRVWRTLADDVTMES